MKAMGLVVSYKKIFEKGILKTYYATETRVPGCIMRNEIVFQTYIILYYIILYYIILYYIILYYLKLNLDTSISEEIYCGVSESYKYYDNIFKKM